MSNGSGAGAGKGRAPVYLRGRTIQFDHATVNIYITQIGLSCCLFVEMVSHKGRLLQTRKDRELSVNRVCYVKLPKNQ